MESTAPDKGKQRDDTPVSSESTQPKKDDHTPSDDMNFSNSYYLPPEYQDIDKPLGRGLPSRPNWGFPQPGVARDRFSTRPRQLVTVNHTHSCRNAQPNRSITTPLNSQIPTDGPRRRLFTATFIPGSLRLNPSSSRLPDLLEEKVLTVPYTTPSGLPILPEEEDVSEPSTSITAEQARTTKPLSRSLAPRTNIGKAPPTTALTSPPSDPLPAYLSRIKHANALLHSLDPAIMEVSVNYLKRHKRPVGDFLRLCDSDVGFLGREMDAIRRELGGVVEGDDWDEMEEGGERGEEE